MRRFSVSLAAVVVLLAGIVTMGTSVTAQPATPAASPVTVSPLVQAWMTAYTSQDSDAYAALYTPDGIYEDVPSGQAAQGHEAITELATYYFESQDDFVFEPLVFFQGDGWAVLETNTAATDAESGQRVTGIRIATVFELDEGRIRRSSDYYDLAGVFEQLGLLEMGEATPETGTPAP